MTTTHVPVEDRTQEQRHPGRLRRDRSQAPLALLLMLPAVLVVLGVVLYPLGRTLVLSTLDVNSSVQQTAPFVGLANYAALLSDPAFWSTLWRTTLFTVFSTGLQLVLGLAVAQFLNQPLRGRWLFRSAVVLVWALPTIVNANMWRWILNSQYGYLNGLLSHLGLIDQYHDWIGGPLQALFVVALADTWKSTALVAILLLAGLQAVPHDIYEAAALDGAGALRRFWHMTLPLLMPMVGVVLVLRTIEAFKVFDIIYVMTRGGPASGTTTIAFFTYLQAFSNQRFGLGSAVAYVTVLCILVLCFVYSRLLRRGNGAAS
ncbi:carbohydrate ABC transporter permease [Kineococcus sp. SYSU DK003]|uniref:carbohydrate ABC transporter permease n=1 Tax=Kineococcus sp. SYSU DK003 TaxID=3383124 RepID=UPI003D7F030A